MSLDFTDDQSTLVQVMAWCRQATSHYLSQCWLTYLSPCGIIRSQWVNCSSACEVTLNSFGNILLWHTQQSITKCELHRLFLVYTIPLFALYFCPFLSFYYSSNSNQFTWWSHFAISNRHHGNAIMVKAVSIIVELLPQFWAKQANTVSVKQVIFSPG